MRQKLTRQMSLFTVTARHDIGKELGVFSEILDATPEMLDRVYDDLTRNRRKETGRNGMTAEQVLRACVLKQYRCLSYEELAFHLEDSGSFRAFTRLEMGQYPSASTLQENISKRSRGMNERLNPFDVRLLPLEIAVNSLNEHGESSFRVQSTGLPQGENAFHPSVALHTLCTEASFSPTDCKAQHSLSMVVGWGNPFLFEENP